MSISTVTQTETGAFDGMHMQHKTSTTTCSHRNPKRDGAFSPHPASDKNCWGQRRWTTGAETTRNTRNTGHSMTPLVSSKRHHHQIKNAGDKSRCKETKEMITNNTWTWTGCWASLVAQLVKNLPARWETWVQSLSWEDPLEKGKATHSSISVWRIPWTVYPRGCEESDTTE